MSFSHHLTFCFKVSIVFNLVCVLSFDNFILPLLVLSYSFKFTFCVFLCLVPIWSVTIGSGHRPYVADCHWSLQIIWKHKSQHLQQSATNNLGDPESRTWFISTFLTIINAPCQQRQILMETNVWDSLQQSIIWKHFNLYNVSVTHRSQMVTDQYRSNGNQELFILFCFSVKFPFINWLYACLVGA